MMRRMVVVVLVLGLATLVPASGVSALERRYEGPLYFARDEGDRPLNRGLYVIGDSISVGDLGNSAGRVPYIDTVRSVGAKAYVRAASGFAVQTHRYYKQWPANGLDAFTDAAYSDASTVFVQLGTNDVMCLHREGLCTDAPLDDDPGYADWAYAQKLAILLEVRAGIDQLMAAGKCVIWAGPREIDAVGFRAEDSKMLNDWIVAYADQNPGRLYSASYDLFVRNSAALRYDLIEQGDDPMHPTTLEGRQAIANLALYVGRGACKMPTPK